MVCFETYTAMRQKTLILVLTLFQILGYQRTLQVPDLWKMDPSREAGTLSSKLDAAWDRRQREAEDWNRRLAAGEISPSVYRRMKWFFKALKADSHGKDALNFSERRSAMEREWRV